MKIQVRYFAILREQAGCSEETLDTAASTPEALFGELAGRHNFSLDASRLKAAVNDDFAAMTTPLNEGDRVVFIPPVAGG